MPSQQKVQEYLERHKIGTIFEGLMSKLISEMPEEPLSYMIRNLQRKLERQASAGMRKSTSIVAARRTSPVRRSLPAASKSADGHDIDASKSYDKPWLAKTKKLRAKKVAADAEEGLRPGWDHRTKTKATFDDLWDDGDAPAAKSRPERSTSPAAKTVGFLGEEVNFCSYGYRGPGNRTRDLDDPLASEFSVDATRGSQYQQPASSVSMASLLAAKASRVTSGEQRRRMVAIAGDTTSRDSGIEEDRLTEADEALELVEDEADLINEGITKSSVKAGKRHQMPLRTAENSQVRVSICARCARVMTGHPSESHDAFGQLSPYEYECDTSRALTQSQPASIAAAAEESEDEEFESVSQVIGPRRPVWDEKSDVELVRTAIKGNHMFSSTNIPNKGRPMFSAETPDWGRQTAPPASLQSLAVEVTGRGAEPPLSASWTPGAQGGARWNEQPDANEATLTPGDRSRTNRVWRVAEDSDAEDASSFYGGGGVRGSKKLSYQGAY